MNQQWFILTRRLLRDDPTEGHCLPQSSGGGRSARDDGAASAANRAGCANARIALSAMLPAGIACSLALPVEQLKLAQE